MMALHRQLKDLHLHLPFLGLPFVVSHLLNPGFSHSNSNPFWIQFLYYIDPILT
jgi:hypothetical protein